MIDEMYTYLVKLGEETGFPLASAELANEKDPTKKWEKAIVLIKRISKLSYDLYTADGIRSIDENTFDLIKDQLKDWIQCR